MDRHKQDLRQAADQAFMDSLDELGKILQPHTSPSPSSSSHSAKVPKQPSAAAKPSVDLDAFAEAAADIEAFMQEQSKQR